MSNVAISVYKIPYLIIFVSLSILILTIIYDNLSYSIIYLNVFSCILSTILLLVLHYVPKSNIFLDFFIIFSLSCCVSFFSIYSYYHFYDYKISILILLSSVILIKAIIESTKLCLAIQLFGAVFATLLFYYLHSYSFIGSSLRILELAAILISCYVVYCVFSKSKIKNFAKYQVKKNISEKHKPLDDKTKELVYKHCIAKDFYLKNREDQLPEQNFVEVNLEELILQIKNYSSLISLENNMNIEIENKSSNSIKTILANNFIYSIAFSIANFILKLKNTNVAIEYYFIENNFCIKYNIKELEFGIDYIQVYIDKKQTDSNFFSISMIKKIINEIDGVDMVINNNSIILTVSYIDEIEQNDKIVFN